MVTGASRGLGLGFAKTLARAGADVVMTSRTLASLEEPAKEIESHGVRAFKVELDVRDQDSIKKAVAATIEEFGRIDILVNNAGCNVRKPALDIEWEDWNLVLETNLRGVFFVAQEVARHMVERKLWPHHQHRLSNLRRRLCWTWALRCQSWRNETTNDELGTRLGGNGITINCLAPGWFKTEQNRVMYEQEGWVEYLCERIPLGRPGSPGDLDGALLLLASDAK